MKHMAKKLRDHCSMKTGGTYNGCYYFASADSYSCFMRSKDVATNEEGCLVGLDDDEEEEEEEEFECLPPREEAVVTDEGVVTEEAVVTVKPISIKPKKPVAKIPLLKAANDGKK